MLQGRARITTRSTLHTHGTRCCPGRKGAVLQKLEEEKQEQNFTILLLCLDNYCEQFCDECRLSQAVSFPHSLHLSLPQHLDRFIPTQGSSGRFD